MRTLLLLRHAKSGWGDPTLADFDRPLAPRGRRTAPRMAQWLAAHGPLPERAVCSTARRARETWELFAAALGHAVDARFEERLYHASPATILGIVADLPDEAKTAILVGHNPGFEETAQGFAGRGAATEAKRSLAQGFPTAGLAIVESRAGSWAELAAGDGALRALMRPRTLGDDACDDRNRRVTP
ncbi:MAG: histidine phosphatase family protein [Alphaproteobacteria bacterium]